MLEKLSVLAVISMKSREVILSESDADLREHPYDTSIYKNTMIKQLKRPNNEKIYAKPLFTN